MSAGVSELEHVLVLSDDIEAARAFYERAVGLRTGDRTILIGCRSHGGQLRLVDGQHHETERTAP